jgi:hypothetical protein
MLSQNPKKSTVANPKAKTSNDQTRFQSGDHGFL